MTTIRKSAKPAAVELKGQAKTQAQVEFLHRLIDANRADIDRTVAFQTRRMDDHEAGFTRLNSSIDKAAETVGKLVVAFLSLGAIVILLIVLLWLHG